MSILKEDEHLDTFANHQLGLIHTRHFDTKYCDKEIFLSRGYLKAKVSSEQKINKQNNSGNVF